MYKIKIIVTTVLLAVALTCPAQPKAGANAVQKYLDAYTKTYVQLYTRSQEGQWRSNIEIRVGDTTNTAASTRADEAMAEFTGSKENIELSRKYLAHPEKLTSLQKKQLEFILYTAANNPQTIPAIVKQRIKAENEQTQKLYGHRYHMEGKDVTVNDIDEILKKEKDMNRRHQAWEESKQVGVELKPGLVNLRNLRNQSVQALGYPDFFTYQVSDYGMKTGEMMEVNDKLMRDLYPLYRELHTWMRYVLASKYGVETPSYLPAHWLPNRWGQDWSAGIYIPGLDPDQALREKEPEWIVKDAEKMYVSLGFDPLPKTFWKRSSLYPYPADSIVKKNNHASAWHIDLNKDVRSLMSVEPNAEWYETAHHELGHIYYYMTYSNPTVPPLLRQGANRAYHEALGTMMGLAAMQKPFLIGQKLIKANESVIQDTIMMYMKEALNTVVFIYFCSGTMTHFEKEMYADNLPADQFNKRWWELTKKYQGIVPPEERGEELCDAATKTHINDDPAQYYDYALSYEILYQLHNHIATKILHQNPRATNYYGHKEIGTFLKKIMYPGASKDWRQVLKQSTGDDLNGKAMLAYFQPLYEWLKKNNEGRTYTLPEHME